MNGDKQRPALNCKCKARSIASLAFPSFLKSGSENSAAREPGSPARRARERLSHFRTLKHRKQALILLEGLPDYKLKVYIQDYQNPVDQ